MHSMALQSNYTTQDVLTKAPSEGKNERLSILHPNETHVITICTIVLLFFVVAALGDGMFISAFAKDVRMRTTTDEHVGHESPNSRVCIIHFGDCNTRFYSSSAR